MGTPKRERQKANRAQKVEEQRKQEQRDLTKDRGLIVGLVVFAVIVALGLWFFFGNEDSETDPTEIVTEEPAIPEQPLPTAAEEESETTDETTDDATDQESDETDETPDETTDDTTDQESDETDETPDDTADTDETTDDTEEAEG